MQTNVPDFIEPPNSPDLNPVDYSILDTLQQLVQAYQEKTTDVDHLKKAQNSSAGT